MELPDDIIRIIRDYSMPISRPDWRHCGQIRETNLKVEFHQKTKYREMKLLYCPHYQLHYYKTTNRVFAFSRYWDTFIESE
jgi:hypothetical protein